MLRSHLGTSRRDGDDPSLAQIPLKATATPSSSCRLRLHPSACSPWGLQECCVLPPSLLALVPR